MLLSFLLAFSPNVEFVLNQKGGLNLSVDGFHFRKKDSNANKTFWRCIKHNAYKCRASITQDRATGRLKFPKYFFHNHGEIFNRCYSKVAILGFIFIFRQLEDPKEEARTKARCLESQFLSNQRI